MSRSDLFWIHFISSSVRLLATRVSAIFFILSESCFSERLFVSNLLTENQNVFLLLVWRISASTFNHNRIFYACSWGLSVLMFFFNSCSVKQNIFWPACSYNTTTYHCLFGRTFSCCWRINECLFNSNNYCHWTHSSWYGLNNILRR